jgi:hypothetical protein
MRPMRYALLAFAILAVLAVGPVYEWRVSKSTEVPAIELRPEPPAREKPSKRPKVEKERKADRQSETGSSGGASLAPAPVPVPAGGDDDDGGDDGGGDD